MTTKLQAKAYKKEIAQLQKANSADRVALGKQLKAFDKEYAAKSKALEKIEKQTAARTVKRSKRIAILTGRL